MTALSTLERAIHEAVDYPGGFQGRGVLFCGEAGNLLNVWVGIRMLRHLGCQLPVELWFRSRDQWKSEHSWSALWARHGVKVRLVSDFMEGPAVANVYLPLFATIHSAFDHLLCLVDSCPVQNVTALFDAPQFAATGAIFWAGSGSIAAGDRVWKALDLEACIGRFDRGQFMVCKSKVWEVLSFASWLATEAAKADGCLGSARSLQPDACFLAWQKFGSPHSVPQMHPDLPKIPGLYSCSPHAVVQHDFIGRPLFQRRLVPRPLHGPDFHIPGLLFEATCRSFVRELAVMGIGHLPPPAEASERLLVIRKTLLESTWFVNGWPKYVDGRDTLSASQGRQTVDPSLGASGQGVPDHSPSTSSTYERELHFSSDGTFGDWSDQFLAAWDLEEDGGILFLNFYDETRRRARFTLANDGSWTGGWGGAKEEKQPLRLRSFEQRAETAFPRRQGIVEIHNSSPRLSDHVVSLYVCCGAANAKEPVRFATPFYHWFERVAHPNVEIVAARKPRGNPGEPVPVSIDLNYFQGAESRWDVSQARSYARLLGRQVEARRPEKVSGQAREPRFENPNTVLFFPNDVAPALEWPESHWRRLAALMQRHGFEVIGVGGEQQGERMRQIFGESSAFWVLDPPPEWIMDAMMDAAGVIATMNSAAHLAGLFEVPCVALQAQVAPEYAWEGTSVIGLVPHTQCAPCRWNMERGYLRLCELGCSALATISPERVAERFLQVSRWKGAAS